MRIAAKHVRYTLEIFLPLLNEKITPALKVLRQLQDTLGDVHDSDVWVTMLSAMRRRAQHQPADDVFYPEMLPGIDMLLCDRQAFREKRFADLLELWQKQERDLRWYGLLRELFAAN